MKKYRQFELWLARMTAKACRRLHLTSPTIAHYQIDIDDAPVMTSKSDSWVRNMINYMACHGLLGAPLLGGSSFFEDGQLTLRRMSGSIFSQYTYVPVIHAGVTQAEVSGQTYGDLYWNQGIGGAYGTLVGSSDVVESFNDYNLGAAIAHGNSAGQLYRNAQNIASRAWNAVARKWEVSFQRTFTNNSGGNVTVKEIGHFVRTVAGLYQNTSTGISSSPVVTDGLMLIRDVLPTPITVANGQTLTVTYVIEYQY